MSQRISLTLATLMLASTGCAGSKLGQIPAAPSVDLQRFMGDWYVIAHIPSYIERNHYDAIESYALLPDSRIQTTYRYRNKHMDAPIKTMSPVGTVRPGTNNAVWGMQFIWPIKAEYVINWVNADYTQTLVARSARDYAWIMAKAPAISETDYAAQMTRLRELGYDTSKVRRMPRKAESLKHGP
jgi:apolipoprotein D and lipocalin family protein